MKEKYERLMNMTEMSMLRWIQGVIMRDHTGSVETRKAATVQPNSTLGAEATTLVLTC